MNQPMKTWDFGAYLRPWKEEKFVADLEDEKYHAEPAVSSGQLKTILEGGLHVLHAEKAGLRRQRESDALRFGTLFHKAALEGPDFLKRFKVMPIFTGLTKDGRESTQSAAAKAKRDAWLLDLPPGAILIEDQAELDQITGMMRSLLAHPIANILMQGGQRELSGFFNHEGFRCRIRIDIFQESLLMVNDLKTTRDATKRAFHKQIIDELYYAQAAFYLLGASKLTGQTLRSFNFVAVEKEPPYLVSVHEVGESLLSCGEKQIARALAQLRAAIETNIWLPEPQMAFTAEAPDWLMNRIEQEVV